MMLRDPTKTDRIDQATVLRRLTGGQNGGTDGALTVAVASGKGGVGKSNIAVNLSVALAARALRVTLIDVDLGLANADLLLGRRCPYNLSHVLSGLRTMDEIIEDAPGHFRFIAGVSGVGRLANLSDFERRRLLEQTRELECLNDVVVLDCGAGISKGVLTFAEAADTVLVVTTPEPTAVTDAYALIKTLVRDRCQADLQLVVNMAGSRSEARRTHVRIAEVAQKFLKYPIADGGYLLQDEHVEMAVRQRCPFVLRYPHASASACIGAIAARLARCQARTVRGGGYFRRVIGLFM